MSLRQNALALAVLTVLIAIIGEWSGDPDLARLWYLSLAVLLLGLAYEGWLADAHGLGVSISAAKPRRCSAACGLAADVTHRLARALTVEIAPDAPKRSRWTVQCRTLVVPPAGASMSDDCVLRATRPAVWPRCARALPDRSDSRGGREPCLRNSR